MSSGEALPPQSPVLSVAKSSSGAPNYSCLACGTAGWLSDAHFSCPSGDSTHDMCINCFGTFVEHCCEESVTGNASTVPIRCSLPNCRLVVPIHHIVPLIRTYDLNNAADRSKPLMELYERAELQVALAQPAQEAAMTCHLCGQYTELFVAPDPDYWNRLEYKRKIMIESVEEYRRHKIESTKKALTAAMGKRIAALQDEIEKNKVKWKSEAVDIVNTSGGMSEAFGKVPAPRRKDVQDIADTLDFGQKIALLRLAPDDEVKDREILARYYSDIPLSSLDVLVQMEAFKGLSPYYEMELDIRKRIDQEHEELKVELATFESKAMKETAVVLKNLKETIDESKMSMNLPEDFKQDEISESTKFFVCKKEDCKGAVCIACKQYLLRDELQAHVCKVDEEHDLFLRVLETLAKASTRVCPMCKFPGMKDLACTHITCVKCNAKWCYLCERTPLMINPAGGGSFGSHNDWYLNTPPNEDRCPQYLHYKYGERENGNRRDGDPARSLAKFHAELQTKAIKELKKQTDSALWARMISTRFPDGIFSVENARIDVDSDSKQ